MSHASCIYCQRLPILAQRDRKGRGISCPHCEQALWMTQGGIVSRLDGGGQPSVARRWPIAVGIVLGGAACLYVATLGIGTVAMLFSKAPAAPMVAAAEPIAPVEPIAAAEPIALLAEPSEPSKAPAVPFVEAKPGDGPQFAEVKPILEPVIKSMAKDWLAGMDAAQPLVKANKGVIPAAWHWSSLAAPADDLATQLAAMPEADLDPDFTKKSRAQVAALADEINRVSKDRHEAYHRKLIKERPDLAGLPFMMGRACLLNSDESAALFRNSLRMRTTLDFVEGFNRQRSYGADAGDALDQFLSTAKGRPLKSCWESAEGVPAMHQIVSAEGKDLRLAMVKYLKAMNNARATEALASRAIFDFDADVRQAAIEGLKSRRKQEYRAELVKGLRYPWAQVVRNAVHVVTDLELTDMVPDLVGMLHEPSPDLPYVQDKAGKKRHMVREVVRINHHRNCMLCHDPVHESGAPADLPAFTQETPAGPVPSADQPFPAGPGTVYYSRQNGIVLVRADVTYLRQDFSLRQEVENSGSWPKMQRFDFFVRTRELADWELGHRPHVPSVSEHQSALISGIQALTGEQNPPQLVAWRALFGGKSRGHAVSHLSQFSGYAEGVGSTDNPVDSTPSALVG